MTNKPYGNNQLIKFQGNKLTERERRYRIRKLIEEARNGDIDNDFIPYLYSINHYNFIVTTQCCTGHSERHSEGRRAHLDFRCKLPERKVINMILRPLQDKFSIDVSLMTECNRLRYVLWFHNSSWKNEVGYFIRLLKKLNKDLKK